MSRQQEELHVRDARMSTARACVVLWVCIPAQFRDLSEKVEILLLGP